MPVSVTVRGASPVFLIGMTTADIQALPQSGAGWTNLVTQSDKDCTPSMLIGNISGKQASWALAAGLRYVATGTESYKTKVVDACEAIRTVDISTTDYQTWLRQMCGWCLAADLVGHRTQAWIDFLTDLRYEVLPGHATWGGIWLASHRSANNHGTLGRASLAAINLFIGDATSTAPDGNPGGFAQDVKFFKGYCGDTTQYGTVASTSSSPPFGRYGVGSVWTSYVSTWTHDPTQDVWTCINPPDPTAVAAKAGAIPCDVFRDNTAYSVDVNGNPVWGPAGASYTYTAAIGVVESAILMAANGYTDVWEWSSQAVRRWRTYMQTYGGNNNTFGVSTWVDPILNHIYGTSFTAVETDSYGFTGSRWLTQNVDWLKP